MLRALTLMIAMPASAVAQAATTAPGQSMASASPFASLMPLVFIFGIFYFLLIRPQQKRMKEHQAMLGALVKGDEVVTSGGIVGKVTKVEAGENVVVEIAKGVEVTVVKATISHVLGKKPVVVTPQEKKKNPHVKNDNSVPSRENIANDN
jgi:preprotein translocase subunit YajC